MKRLFLYGLSGLLLLTVLAASAQDRSASLMPRPQKITYGKGSFALQGARVYIPHDLSSGARQAIDGFIARVKERTGVRLQETGEASGQRLITFAADAGAPSLPVPGERAKKQSREAYTVSVNEGKVSVSGRSDAGLFYALQTVEQLLKGRGSEARIPAVNIEDYPALAYRGVMFDISHGGLPTVAEIKRQLDFLARWKINQYFFYNEVSIELKGYPLINFNSHYSQQQITDIIAYAKARYIQVIPLAELYGHLHDLFKVEKYADLAIVPYGHELDPRKPQVRALLKDWIRQYAQLFPSPFFHIGFDETWETIQVSKTDKSIDPKKLYIDELDFVTREFEKYGKKVMVWSDITADYPDITASFPKSVIPVVWEYSADTGAMNKWIRPVMKEKFPFFIQSGVDGWQHIYPDAAYTYDNIDLCVKTCLEDQAIGYSTSLWSDAIQTLMRNSWLFMAYGGVVSWQGTPPDRDSFLHQYCRLVYPGISGEMENAFKKLNESQMYFEKCFHGRHTLPDMFMNPFSEFSLKNTREHIQDYKKARLAAEDAQESLMAALQGSGADTAFIQTLLVNSRLLDYTGMRFLFARTIVDYWDDYVSGKGVKDQWIMFYDIEHSEHGLTDNVLEYISELKPEYREAWLSQYTPYRMNDMLGRLDAEFQFWYELRQKIQYYKHYYDLDKKPATFEQTFKSLVHPFQ
jgi:hypothetical protein